ncbi:hypothetical protein AZE42_11601 [Rhizopogon vesiculosus]|uniref:Histone H2A/H2B/H3 domain-containing protein n=1 Tax=Rhizopogon vesiculosus TaxID=180088 RepID=A0A1J8R2S5_9AGAM|nr:hypothetical protein AZE42_11601 [Rhizopogon vesiculosus]
MNANTVCLWTDYLFQHPPFLPCENTNLAAIHAKRVTISSVVSGEQSNLFD